MFFSPNQKKTELLVASFHTPVKHEHYYSPVPQCASARNISCVAPRCVQVQETSVAQYRDVCKCKKHQLRSTEMCASATYVNIPPPPTHPTHTKDVTCHVLVCKCKKHQLRSTEMFASARNISCVAPRCVQVQETSVA